jgi:hypothetical protein
MGSRQRLDRLIELAVAQQFRRPMLARILDTEEDRLPPALIVEELRADLTSSIVDLLASIPSSNASESYAADNVIAIIRGMVDGASRRGEECAAILITRVSLAVFGYLSLT